MRTCRKCGKSEKETRFYSRQTVAGIAAGNMCAPCWIAKAVEWRKANKERWNRQRHALKLKKRFGINQQQFDDLYSNPSCCGCGVKTSQNGKRLALDHDHESGRTRGLLCHDCNRTIATAHDNPLILRRLAKYLRK